MMIAPLVQPAFALVTEVLELFDRGLSDEEVLERLADPNGVGRKILADLRKRRELGRDLLGRDPVVR